MGHGELDYIQTTNGGRIARHVKQNKHIGKRPFFFDSPRMTQLFVSIIIPIYKVEPYLRRCLDSVVNQTYPNLEIILVDDGSPDNCPQICNEYAAKDKRIIVIHKENGGLSDARNAGTKLATGDFIYYLDSDDELPHDSIQSLVDYVEPNPEAEIIVGKMHCPQNESMYEGQLFNYDYVIKNNIEFRKYYSKNSNVFPVNACNKLINRNFIIKNNLFFKKGIIHEDQLWMFLVSRIVKHVVCIDKITYIRYLNSESITTASSNEAKFHSWGIILKEIFSKLDTPAFAEQFSKNFMLLENFYSQISAKEVPLYNEVWKESAICAKRNGHYLLAFFLLLHKRLKNILHGHGTGFAIWFLLNLSHT